MNKIRIVLVDDQVLFVRSLKVVLETTADDMEVMGIAHNGREGFDLVKELNPDAVLLDVRMPVMDGVEAAQLIHRECPETLIMMLTTFDDDEYVKEALHNGAAGYLLKDIPPEELVSSIRAMQEGATQLSPEIVSKLVDSAFTNGGKKDHQSPKKRWDLNRRELEVFKFVTQGLDNREIAHQLHVAEQTVKNYVSSLYSKIDAKDRVHAMRLGLKTDFDKL